MFFKKSSETAVRESISELYPKLWRFCLGLTSNVPQAEDLAQAVCLQALEKHYQFKVGTNLRAWLFTIARNKWINELRQNAIRTGGGLLTLDDVQLQDLNIDTETNIFARQMLLKVMELPEAQREAVLLVYVEGMSYREASEIMDVPIGTVMSRLATARAKLAETAGSSERRHYGK